MPDLGHLIVMDLCFNSLASTRGIREQGRTGGLD